MDKYEKLYNEALERFKSFKEKYYTKDTNLGDVIFDKNGEMQKDFNGIFPELCDSEDERIRKWILEKVQEYADSGIPCSNEIQMANKTIAWLEEQKEYVSEKFDDVWASEDCEELIAEGKKLSPRFEKLLKDVCHAWYDKGIEVGVKQKEQSLRDFIDDFPYSDQKEQKPAEWSEDEKIVNNIVSVLGQYIDYKAVSGTGSGYATPRYAKEIDWLKSLRPSWKPSEEQMEAFRSYIKDFQEKAEAAVGGWNNFDVMIRLFEQLKKLI